MIKLKNISTEEMSDITYDSIQAEIAQADINADAEKARLLKKKRDFIRQQSFTGDELLIVRDSLKNSSSDRNEPWLDYILEQILENRR